MLFKPSAIKRFEWFHLNFEQNLLDFVRDATSHGLGELSGT
jgi:hypothetical protein